MITLATLNGTVTVTVGNMPAVVVASFEVPVTADIAGAVTVPHDTIRAAAAGALDDAAELLRSTDDVVFDEPELLPGFRIIRCPDCDAALIHQGPGSLQHADGGAHVLDLTYGADDAPAR